MQRAECQEILAGAVGGLCAILKRLLGPANKQSMCTAVTGRDPSMHGGAGANVGFCVLERWKDSLHCLAVLSWPQAARNARRLDARSGECGDVAQVQLQGLRIVACYKLCPLSDCQEERTSAKWKRRIRR